jgi:hypothetical protein
MGRVRQASLIIAVIAVLYLAMIYIPAWHARYEASRLLAALHEIHPGTTSEIDARALLLPLARYEDTYGKSNDNRVVQYGFVNISRLFGRVAGFLPRFWQEHVLLPDTLFLVTVTYQGGLTKEVHVIEMQDDFPGNPHPNSASTTILSNHMGKGVNLITQSSPEDFTGFSMHKQSTRGYDEAGKATSFECCRERFITLDERATPAQLTDSLNFHLYCMTSWRRCKDDRAILP